MLSLNYSRIYFEVPYDTYVLLLCCHEAEVSRLLRFHAPVSASPRASDRVSLANFTGDANPVVNIAVIPESLSFYTSKTYCAYSRIDLEIRKSVDLLGFHGLTQQHRRDFAATRELIKGRQQKHNDHYEANEAVDEIGAVPQQLLFR